MKTLFFALLVLPFLAFQCRKGGERPGDCVQGKVIRITCASYVVQALNNNSLGDDGWEDTFAYNTKYDNVFQVTNLCKMPGNLKVGDVFYFKISGNAPADCMVCAMYDAAPKAAYSIVNVSLQPCMKD